MKNIMSLILLLSLLHSQSIIAGEANKTSNAVHDSVSSAIDQELKTINEKTRNLEIAKAELTRLNSELSTAYEQYRDQLSYKVRNVGAICLAAEIILGNIPSKGSLPDAIIYMGLVGTTAVVTGGSWLLIDSKDYKKAQKSVKRSLENIERKQKELNFLKLNYEAKKNSLKS